MARRTRLLLLGEGNFSLSLALERLLGRSIDLVATSFDSKEQVHQKYPETKSFLQRLEGGGAIVRHDIDATSFTAASLKTGNEDSFQHIIFSFPHSGTEDARRHSSLLGHFFHHVSKAELLAEGGAVHITLAGEQPQRWRATEQASRHGLELVHRTPFPGDRLAEFEAKRHHTGKSFQGLKMQCFALSYARPGCVVKLKQQQQQQQQQQGEKLGEEGAWDPALAAMLPPWMLPSRSSRGDDARRGTKRGFAGTELKASAAMAEGAVKAGGASHACTKCEKKFTSQRGLASHINAQHRSQGADADADQNAPRQYRCPECDRIFGAEAALAEHRQAKHSSPHTSIKPEWAKESGGGTIYLRCDDKTGAANEAAHDCKVCGFAFATLQDYKQHLSNLHPLEDAAGKRQHLCERCQREFRSLRSLLQHQNHCKLAVGSANVAPIACQHCRKEFRAQKGLDIHQKYCQR